MIVGCRNSVGLLFHSQSRPEFVTTSFVLFLHGCHRRKTWESGRFVKKLSENLENSGKTVEKYISQGKVKEQFSVIVCVNGRNSTI